MEHRSDERQRVAPNRVLSTGAHLYGGTTSTGARVYVTIERRTSPSPPVEPPAGAAPYRGLESFREEHAELFFGREREVRRLLEILKTSPLLCVVGSSGCGKSSLVRAGLVPRLRDGGLGDGADRRVCVLRPGAHPLAALPSRPDPGRHDVIVVDQLEEVFTLCDDERERERFFASLLHAASTSGRETIVVLTIRADFFARCAEYPELAQRMAGSCALVEPMLDDELCQAIEQPARRAGLRLEPGLVQTIIDDVGPDDGALAMLEHALLMVCNRRVDDELTLAGYVRAGRVQGALAGHAEDVWATFSAEQREIARRMLLRLAQPGDGTAEISRRAPRLRLAVTEDKDGFDTVLQRLVDARLLTTGSDEAGDDDIELAHEALIRGWPRLGGWIDEELAGRLIPRPLTDATRHAESCAAERDKLAVTTATFSVELPPVWKLCDRMRFWNLALAAVCGACIAFSPFVVPGAIALVTLMFLCAPTAIMNVVLLWLKHGHVRIATSDLVVWIIRRRRISRSAVCAAPRVHYAEVSQNISTEKFYMLLVDQEGRGLARLDEQWWRRDDLRAICGLLGVAWQERVAFDSRHSIRRAYPASLPVMNPTHLYLTLPLIVISGAVGLGVALLA